jgi:ketosteroid isomerase-like protein
VIDDPQTGADLGVRFVDALVAKDRDALTGLFDPQVEFRGLTPSRHWEASDPDGVADIVFGSWFEPHDRVRDTLEAGSEPFADRRHLRYRLRVESDGTDYVVEQQGFFDIEGGRITRMSLMCSGFRPWQGV